MIVDEKFSVFANSVILSYFSSLNSEDFPTTASLFVEDGALIPPFAEPILGREAIAFYLEKEAYGMRLFPDQATILTREDNLEEVHVIGKVKTPLFIVNVAWDFILDSTEAILAVQVKLLASPDELLNLRQYHHHDNQA